MSATVQESHAKDSDEENIDFLENDMPIPGQNYVCLSFISPESCIQDKQLFMMYNFLLDKKGLTSSFDEFKSEYEEYLSKDQEKLNKQFHENNDFTTSVRGLKVRGVYDNVVEAKYRAKQLQRTDPLFNVFVGQVGFWLPWDPAPEKISEQEYLNDQLNNLMKSYKDNQNQKDQSWMQNKRNVISKANEETKKQYDINNKTTDAAEEEKLASMEDADPWMKRKMTK